MGRCEASSRAIYSYDSRHAPHRPSYASREEAAPTKQTHKSKAIAPHLFSFSLFLSFVCAGARGSEHESSPGCRSPSNTPSVPHPPRLVLSFLFVCPVVRFTECASSPLSIPANVVSPCADFPLLYYSNKRPETPKGQPESTRSNIHYGWIGRRPCPPSPRRAALAPSLSPRHVHTQHPSLSLACLPFVTEPPEENTTPRPQRGKKSTKTREVTISSRVPSTPNPPVYDTPAPPSPPPFHLNAASSHARLHTRTAHNPPPPIPIHRAERPMDWWNRTELLRGARGRGVCVGIWWSFSCRGRPPPRRPPVSGLVGWGVLPGG